MRRYEIPIDDKPHSVALTDSPVAAATQQGNMNVEIWAEYNPSKHPIVVRVYQVFGTGQTLPANARHRLTCLGNGLGLVWHLYELV